VFPNSAGYAGYSGSALTVNTYSLTNKPSQVASVSVGSTTDLPFLTNELCPITAQGFSLTFSFSISAPGASFNSIGSGLAISFVDGAVNLPDFPRIYDQNGMLVPNATSVTLQVDTYDDACGATPATPCTGTWTQYDNSKVSGAGIGYRVVSTAPTPFGSSTVNSVPLATQLLYGGRYTAVTDDVRARVMDIAPCVRVLTCVRYPFCRCR
jgi:hypothetical protein